METEYDEVQWIESGQVSVKETVLLQQRTFHIHPIRYEQNT